MDYVEIQGAREHNLQNVSVRIPKRRIVVFTGVSGSGKSSLVFDTVAAESQRQINETFTAFVRTFLPKYGQPDADSIANLSTAIVVDQKRLHGGARSTVGTITDIYALLRLLFSRVGKPWVGYSNAFSFNDTAGMCPTCDGIGTKIALDLDRFLDRSRSLNDGALLHPQFAVGGWYGNVYALSGHFDLDKPLADYSEDGWRLLLHGGGKVKVAFSGASEGSSQTFNTTYEGLVDKFERLYIKRETGEMSDRNRAVFERFVTQAQCPDCKGTRLNDTVLGCRIDGRNIADLAAMQVSDLVPVVAAVTDPVGAPMVAGLTARLGDLVDIGLGYLSLDRETSTLSGGESQRIKMVKHLGSSLIDLTYIFDEPSIGLHARDVERLTRLLHQLKDKGNSVFVVEHDRDVIEDADHVIDLGPGAGNDGGHIVYQGDVAGLVASATRTGEHLRRGLPIKPDPRTPTGQLPVEHATLHNLNDVSVNFPTGALTVVTGVAGSGKSTLVNKVFRSLYTDAIAVDQAPVSTNRRSNPATYTGILDEIRNRFARANKVSPSLFSSNSKGACENCQGLGIVYTDLAFLDPMTSLCEVCQGRRFKEAVLAHKLRDRSITDVLEMTVADALEFFTEPKVRAVLQALFDVGLTYLTLGQPLSTLSGGECQRIKLAGELHRTGSLYVMDEPTTGLHMSDTADLIAVMDRLVDGGATVIVIEHNLDVVKQADWIIDLGPDGGHDGGRVMFEGTPSELLASTTSVTAEYLRRATTTSASR